MDPIQNKSKGPNKPDKKNWYDAKTRYYIKRNKSKFYEHKLKKQGKKDAKRGIVRFTEDGTVKSPFCNQLVETANKKIISIWEDCDFDLTDVKAFLDYMQEKFDKLIQEIPTLEKRKEQIIKNLELEDNEADTDMSEVVVNSRKNRRISSATDEVNNKLLYCEQELDTIIKDCKQAVTDLENREQIACSQNDKVNHDLREDVSIYMQGTWKELDTERFDAKPPETTKKPKDRHYDLFPKYCFSIKTRIRQIEKK